MWVYVLVLSKFLFQVNSLYFSKLSLKNISCHEHLQQYYDVIQCATFFFAVNAVQEAAVDHLMMTMMYRLRLITRDNHMFSQTFLH